MRITFLGTSAANAYPEAFCRCANCQRARALGGPSLRKRSALLVNDDLLIDLGPYVMTAAQIHGRPLAEVRYCLQTHAHADHLDVSHLLSRSLFYGVDTASLPEETWHALRRTEQRFNVVILDHTYGPEEEESDHLSARTLIAHAQRMREEGLLAPDGRVFATHIAHGGNPAHPELAAFAADHGYEVAYDGLTLSV